MSCSSRYIAHGSTTFLLVGSKGQVKLWRSSDLIDSSRAGMVGWEGILIDVCNDNDVMCVCDNSDGN
jgi:hypothetical protein